MFSKLLKLFKSSSIYIVGNVLSRALFIISMPIMTRYMVSEEYGTLSVVNAVIGILMTFYGFGLHDFAMRYYYEYKTEEERTVLLGAITSFIIAIAFILSITLSILWPSIFTELFKGIAFSPYFLLAIWISFMSVFEIVPDALFRIRDQAGLLVSIQLTKSLLSITLSIISVVILKRGAEGPLVSLLIVYIIFGCYFIFYLKDKIKINFSFSIICRSLRFSLPIMPLLLGRVFLDATDRLILQRFVDLSVVAFYSVGSTIGSVLVMIGGSINMAWAPFFYGTAKDETDSKAKEIFSYASTYVGAIILFLGLCAVIFRHEIIYILAPPSYYVVIEIIPFIMIGAIFNALFFIPVRGIYQQKKTVYLPIIILVALIINVALNFILIPKFQMLGAALATVAASFVMLVLCFIISQKLYCIPYQYNRLFKIFVICILCYVLSEFIRGYSLITAIFLKSFIVMLFPLFIYLFRFFEPREIEKIKHLTRQCIRRVKPT